ncbi:MULTISPECIES: 6-phospho-beta-glucosidase [Streptomyces]|uniref:6-phospho-beta-glucosidase n=2 Tax=Streptomyces TaxID=1883 RepID=A0A3R7LJH3_9ACTN|nr:MULTISPECIES: 6-phospho-beta-glucosidase [Streptomyces]KNE80755.1 6-phospho-beta-glucosidase [Streptomyces fradiae]OFA49742.1 6-phospho-beta-glucosidase [Streptomyces fradiae]PQM23049.1 6-phospho-beta-glucosidase [Streptomyces xinghaiensis]RKM91415.1 6-phospho-beta-glucosidase [Streptomyces xinghaiensis]RNC74949.1 6-phospho-beta-glucosidase [Streptomyces xinghaiensis]
MRLTVLGGGGFRVPLVYRALLDDSGDPAGRCTELVLYDTDRGRLDAIGAVLARQAARRAGDGRGTGGPAPAVRLTTELDDALRGADFVFSAIRVGGLEGRVRDERIPLAEGVLGQETVGAGGVLYGLRTLPVAVRIAERVATVAPDAWVINFTNPAGMVTEAMGRVFRERGLPDRVIGICDSPVGLCRRAARALGADPDRADYDYVGLNHLGWLRRLTVDGRDLLPSLLGDRAALESFEEGKLFGADWLRALGALPNEYLHYYYFNRETVASVTAAEATRGEFLHRQQARFYAGEAAGGDAAGDPYEAWERTRLEREETYMAESREATGGWQRDSCDLDGGGYDRVALALMRAIARNERTKLILNVPGRGAVPALDADAVVEVPCLVDAGGARPLAAGPVAPDQLGLMLTLKAVERSAIGAAESGSRTAALRALALHPLVDSVRVAERILDAAGGFRG